MLREDIHNLPSNLPSAEPEREKGRWIPVSCRRSLGESGVLIKEYVEESDPYDVVAVKCSKCGAVFDFDDARYFCSQCGADMRTKETDCDYERAVEQLEHDMSYEPTFNRDNGSM